MLKYCILHSVYSLVMCDFDCIYLQGCVLECSWQLLNLPGMCLDGKVISCLCHVVMAISHSICVHRGKFH